MPIPPLQNETQGTHGVGPSRVRLTSINFLEGAEFTIRFKCSGTDPCANGTDLAPQVQVGRR